ncbi:MAG: ABC transporter permease [Halodesulfurarchaeum sp.]
MSSDRRSTVTRLKWRIVDAAIAAKERLPARLYERPPPLVGYLLLVPGILLVSFLFVGMGILAVYSVLRFDPFEILVYEITLENWVRLFTGPGYLEVFVRTILLSSAITILAVALGLPYAYLTIRVRSAIVRKVLLVSLFVPFFTGVIVRAYGWLILLGRNGLVNAVLGVLGIGPIRFIGSELGVTIGLLQIMTPLAIIMLAPAIQHIDRSLELAASNLGANRIQTFRRIVIPLAAPGIAGATIVVFTITAATFAIPDIIGGGRVEFVANVIYRLLYTSGNYPLAAVMSVALVVITSIVVLSVFWSIGAGTLGIQGGDSSG